MLVGAGNTWLRMAHVALLAGVLTGCSEAAEGDGSKASARPSATAETSGPKDTAATTAATSGGTVGAAGSACELPVTFDIAKSWKAEAVEAPLRQGPVSLACEIDAKPAGNIGFLRVWAGTSGDADTRAVLEAFVAAEDGVTKEKYRTFTSGGVSGVEVAYLYSSELLEETKKESAFAVTTADGPVVVHLGGLDTEEHEEMLPAYELARRTLRTA
ncbi:MULTISPECIES: lipoprotein [Streptomyces]|uniref:lipoprotein n=1 Tax=Streptomyces TaxID=1883 RepID=UPI003255C91F|nr:lipoprotein [Streptomyces canus]WSZ36076.1 lipoprotein [Streptomyces sp. NBC_00882]WSZ63004.1 lipoprotein [Streptomyces canus]